MLIKFCGLRSASDIEAADQLNVDFYGIIFHENSPRYVEPAKARLLPLVKAKRVGVFTTQKPEAMLETFDVAKLDMAQLHGDQSIDIARKIGPERVIRVMWPMRYPSLAAFRQDALKYADNCAYYLLDAGLSGGGGGLSMTFENLQALKLPKPWILAGGLKPDNVADAIKICKPNGVDLNSGIENETGVKMPEKMRLAIKAIKGWQQIVKY